MKTKHTGGTWYGKDGQIYPTETGVTLAIIPYFDKDNKEQEANLQLIAHSPELLRIVYDLMQVIQDDPHAEDAERRVIEAHELLYRINPDYNL